MNERHAAQLIVLLNEVEVGGDVPDFSWEESDFTLWGHRMRDCHIGETVVTMDDSGRFVVEEYLEGFRKVQTALGNIRA